jgi:hypothetical protein
LKPQLEQRKSIIKSHGAVERKSISKEFISGNMKIKQNIKNVSNFKVN